MRENLAAAALFALSQKLPGPCHLWDPMCGSGTFVFEAENFFRSTQRSFNYQTSVLNLGVAPWKPKAAERDSLFLSARGSDIKKDLMEKLGAPFFTHDFFSQATALPAPCVVVTNPPYGERIKLAVSVEVFQKNLLTQLQELKIERALIVRPLSWRAFNTQIYSTTALFQVSNGGIEVEMTYLERRA
jgi:23S rRNA G2445 N2-methylase RlmL